VSGLKPDPEAGAPLPGRHRHVHRRREIETAVPPMVSHPLAIGGNGKRWRSGSRSAAVAEAQPQHFHLASWRFANCSPNAGDSGLRGKCEM